MRKDNCQFELLLDLVEGRLDEATAVALTDSIQSNSELQADMAWIKNFGSLSQDIVLATPDPSVHDVLKRRFEVYAQDRRQPSFFQRIKAALTFDSQTQFALSGVRSAGQQGQERQVVYGTDVADIALNILPRPQDEQFNLYGQVFPLTDETREVYTVQLLHDAVEWQVATTNQLGEFWFEAMPSQTYEVVVIGDQFELVIAPLSVNL